MKKLFLLIAFISTAFISAQAQSERAQQLQLLKDQVKPLIMQKTSLTDAQADRVVSIHFSYSGRLDKIANVQGEEKQKITEEILAAEKKEFLAIPLNEAQITIVRKIFADHKKKATE